MKRGQDKNGFTIVELLIVIIILGILAGLIIAAYSGMRSRAEISASKVETSNFVKALELQKAETGVFPVSISAGATELPGYKLAAGNQVAKYSTSNNNTSFRACVITTNGTATSAYTIYDTSSGGLVESGSGAGPSADCAAAPPPPPEYVNGIRCPVITFGTPFPRPGDEANRYRVSVTYSDSTISRITDIDGEYVYIDQGALRRYEWPRTRGVNWNNASMEIRGSNGQYRYDCKVTWSWPAD